MDVGFQAGVETDVLIGGVVIVAEAAAAACLPVGQGPCAGLARGENAFLRLGQRRLVDVGGEDLAALVKPRLFEQDGQRLHLFAGGATRLPDGDVRP